MSEELVQQLDPIFRPKSVAIIGASNNPTKWGGMVMNRAMESNFRGQIYPVNPRESEISGIKAYTDVLKIPGPVDLAVFTIPAEHMPKTMEDCIKKGIPGGLIISADFAETGERGRLLQDETLKIARAGGLRFIGPNGNGMWTSAVGLNMSPFPLPPRGGLAFLSQSGMFGGAAMRAAQTRGFGVSKYVAMGNQADLTAADYLEYLAVDEQTRVIVLYMEGVKDGARFARVARRVTREKPVLILKGGRSKQGARATLSHTASIAGEDRVFDGMCRQAGIIRVFQLEHLFVMAAALLGQALPRGDRIAVVGNGGESVTTVDNLVELGVEVPEFRDEDKRALKEILPPHAPVPSNPVDFAAGAVGIEDEVRVIEKLASLDYIDAIITGTPRERTFRAKTLADQKKAVISAMDDFCQIPERYGTPILTMSGMPSRTVDEMLKDAKIPIYNTVEECALAMYALVEYARIRRQA